MGNSSSINNDGNSTAAPRVDGEEDRISNKRKRSCDGNGDVVSTIDQPLFEMLGDPSLSTMPDSVLLHTFSFILSKDGYRKEMGDSMTTQPDDYQGDKVESLKKSLRTQLALEKTCRRLHSLLGQDSSMSILYHLPQFNALNRKFSYQTESLREELFIFTGLRLVVKYQKGCASNFRYMNGGYLICPYMGGANGLRRIIDKILVRMEQPVPDEADGLDAVLGQDGAVMPQKFPPNGFKLFLRGDSIAYLAEVVEQHMVDRLEAAMHAAIFRSKPEASHPYPAVCPEDLAFVDVMRGSFEKGCVVGRHQKRCSMLSLGDSPKKWIWPENNCIDDEIIGALTMQHLVRAIASRAGIVKLSGPAFECIAAEILHFLAVIVIDAFEVSKSLWCHGTDIGRLTTPLAAPANQVIADDIICDLSKCTLASPEDSIHSQNSMDSEKSFAFNYMSNYPPPMEVDEEGKHVCVIIPRQIKDAAVRLGMKPLLDDQRWEVSEGRTKKEEVKEALLMYDLSLDDESSMPFFSDEESVWQPNDEEESSESESDEDESSESDSD
jgi:hypothetical protein